jgi:hypothetical protein
VVNIFVDMFKMEIVEKKGTSCRRLVWEHKFTMTKDEILISNEAFLKGVSTRFGLRTIEKYIEGLYFINCSSFQNLRLGSITFGNVCHCHCHCLADIRPSWTDES